jgi:DNA polymerase III subunit delta
VSAEPLLPAYLLTGSDQPKVARALRRLRSRFSDEAIEQLSADGVTGAEAVTACNALGLFAGDGGGRLVIVERVERWKKADVEAVAGYLADPVPGAVLALVVDEPPRSDALAKVVTSVGRVLAYDAPKPRDLPGWVRAQFDGFGVSVEPETARALVELVGDDLVALTTEADKMSIWAGGRPITPADVEALAAPAREAAVWAITDAWGERDSAALLAAADAELERRDPFAIAVRLAAHVGLVRSAKAFAAEGIGAKEIAKRIRVHEFRVRKALGHADRYSEEELDAAVVRLAALDAALKGASRLSGELELTRALADLTAEPARAPRQPA